MSVVRRYSKLSRKVWNDDRFRRLSAAAPNAQTLWLRLLSGPELSTVPGMIVVGESALAESLGWTLAGFRKAFEEIEAEGLAKAEWKSRLVWVPKAIVHNEPQSINVIKGWAIPWDEAPECDLKHEVWAALKAFTDEKGDAWSNAFEKACPDPSGKAKGMATAMPKVMPKPMASHGSTAIQEQEQEQEQETHYVRLACATSRVVSERDVVSAFSDGRKVAWQARYGKPCGVYTRATKDYEAMQTVLAALAKEPDPLAALTDSLAGFFSDSWASEHDWPFGAWARDQGRYQGKAGAVAKVNEADKLAAEEKRLSAEWSRLIQASEKLIGSDRDAAEEAAEPTRLKLNRVRNAQRALANA